VGVVHVDVIEAGALLADDLEVGAGVHRLLRVDEELPQARVGVDPADAQARRDDLAERADREDERIAVRQLVQRRHVVLAEAEHPVGVVVEDHAAPLPCEVEQAAPALQAHRHAGGILEGRHRVDDLGRAPGCGDSGDERVEVHPVLVDGYLEQLGLVGQRRRRAVRVRRRLDRDEVAGVDEELVREIEALHPAGGDDETVRARRIACAIEL
jgi:hypothetical protein